MFDKLNPSASKSIKRFANEKKLRIIQVTSINTFDYCDSMMINSPFDFLNYMYHADYIITDTFHGTMFSIILEKQFVVIDKKKNKVEELLACFHLDDRMVNENEHFPDMFNDLIRYDSNNVIKEYRDASMSFLIASLEGIEHDSRK
ncbi:polysaccharide pyruvyl transferase family protein [Ruminococcus flavefaciens]|uniref:polysaccharide pyruvyl transferase family protein n=1 Tax=Ruminococcus flavefaciens TaxID=1265 RepID=UPI0026EE12A4|nr:polysaccharide pyruvyl transferase family protein [Ruminococcus flavefaciens]